MNEILENLKKPYKIYAEVLDAGALVQFEAAMALDDVVSGALMPDAHLGYTLPIGAVVAVKDRLYPSFVGYDISCGMSALRLPAQFNQGNITKFKKLIFEDIYKRIPVGFNKNKKPTYFDDSDLSEQGKIIANKKHYQHALGSLGGGNHFCEIGYDEEDRIWVVVHSGSRGVGHAIASHYMTIASSDEETLGVEFDNNNTKLLKYNPIGYASYRKKFIEKCVGRLRPKEGFYGLDVDSFDGDNYRRDLRWCDGFALASRELMIRRILESISKETRTPNKDPDFSILINRSHNHAEYKDGVWIHRKGATHAEDGMMGVIPGNMFDGSFIVRGKGNPESLYSSSHGAGRVLGRKEAKRKLKVDDFRFKMAGVQAKVNKDTLDESPAAYKNIFEVMRLQCDLVDIVAHVKPIINIKG